MPPPILDRQTSGSVNIPIAPAYSSGTFGGGGIGEPLLLIPAISTYPLTAKLRDDLLNKVKIQQQTQQQQAQSQQSENSSLLVPSLASIPSSSIVCDPKDAGVVLLSEQTNGGIIGQFQTDCLG